MSAEMKYVILPNEIETYVRSLTPSVIEDLGSKRWFDNHDILQKICQQAILEASEFREEVIKEMMVTFEKIPVCVSEVICISVWREKVFPELLKAIPTSSNTFIPYLILYHEATAVSLLEILLFHSECVDCLGDFAIDLVDYCMYAVIRLTTKTEEIIENTEFSEESELAQELRNQEKELQFSIGIASISILRYIAENLSNLPVSITTRVYETHDLPLLMLNLIEKTPWCKFNNKGQLLKFIDKTWKLVIGEEVLKLTRVEGQVWLALRELLLDPLCSTHYDLNDFRRHQLMKLQTYMNDLLLDQLSPLQELKAWIYNLQVHNPSKKVHPIMIEVVAELKNKFLKKSKKEWKTIITSQINLLLGNNQDNISELSKRLSKTYDLDTLETLAIPPPTCVQCGDMANKRCSRCKLVWYCNRECQVNGWAVHKDVCNKIADYWNNTVQFNNE